MDNSQKHATDIAHNPFPSESVEYAERRVGFFEQWLSDHNEVQKCQKCEDLIRDVNTLLKDILRIDSGLQESYFDGAPFNDALSKRLSDLVARWHKMACQLDSHANVFEAKSYSVDGSNDLRRNIKEVAAMLAPSEDIDGDMIGFMEKSVEEFRAGKGIFEGIVD